MPWVTGRLRITLHEATLKKPGSACEATHQHENEQRCNAINSDVHNPKFSHTGFIFKFDDVSDIFTVRLSFFHNGDETCHAEAAIHKFIKSSGSKMTLDLVFNEGTVVLTPYWAEGNSPFPDAPAPAPVSTSSTSSSASNSHIIVSAAGMNSLFGDWESRHAQPAPVVTTPTPSHTNTKTTHESNNGFGNMMGAMMNMTAGAMNMAAASMNANATMTTKSSSSSSSSSSSGGFHSSSSTTTTYSSSSSPHTTTTHTSSSSSSPHMSMSVKTSGDPAMSQKAMNNMMPGMGMMQGMMEGSMHMAEQAANMAMAPVVPVPMMTMQVNPYTPVPTQPEPEMVCSNCKSDSGYKSEYFCGPQATCFSLFGCCCCVLCMDEMKDKRDVCIGCGAEWVPHSASSNYVPPSARMN